MENLDDLMRKKFDSDDPAGRFEFREEFWEQAQVLIEADEARRKKRRRRVLWWWFLFAGLAIGSWQLAEWSSRREHAAEQSRQTNSPANTGAARNETQSASGNKHTTTPDAAGTEQATSGVSGKNNPETPSATTSATGHNTTDNQHNTTNNNRQSTSPKGGDPNEKQSRFAPSARPKDRKNGAKEGPNTSRPTSTAPQVSAPVNSGTGNSSAAESVDKQNGQNIASETPSATADSGAVQTSAAPDATTTPLGLLPTLSGLLDLPQRSLKMPGAAAENTPIKPARESKWRLGVAVTGSAGQVSLDNKRLGASAGIVLQRRLTPALSASAGLRWRYLSGTWARDTIPTESTQLRYSFGFVRDEWSLRGRGQHFLEIPLALRWQRNRLTVEAGVSAGWLAGVRGEIVRRHSESLQPDVRIDRTATWLSTSLYHRFVPGVFAGAEWSVTRRLGLTVQGNWRPGKIGTTLSPDAPPPANLMRLDAGVCWYF